MLRISIRGFMLFGCFFCSFNAFAWWDSGHRLVALIAYNNLDFESQRKFDELTQTLRRDYPKANLATWPDAIRKQSIEAYTHWHYLDTPYSSDGSATGVSVDTDNAVWALAQINRVLSNKEVPPSEQARFTSFLVHITGDLHQPLHAIARSNKELPQGDEGGNLFWVKDPNHQESLITLHALWDSNFGLFKDLSEEKLQRIAEEITSAYPRDYFSNQELNAPPKIWAQESYSLAKNWVYSTTEKEVPSLEYQKQSQELIKQRIALAGYRLALLLTAS
ncbi:S1/P1 nuclease [Legionella lytica]|uniref:S1/P1 nuclease n=1 Tax=Legionella lytica TaxID=96232 RepID=A0ABY4Y7D6_9GAMM|nr:S1/P1 nuclease [Legionella lytica]USQ13072.1 S1/P1 nuclease [Legionella lytica]